MKPGQAWHLAGANIETTADLIIGGQAVKAGKYALSARKGENHIWNLTLHPGRGFSSPKLGGEDVHELETTFEGDSTLYEHMSVDVQPAGDKEHTRLNLEVRFDTLLATALIEVPPAPKKPAETSDRKER